MRPSGERRASCGPSHRCGALHGGSSRVLLSVKSAASAPRVVNRTVAAGLARGSPAAFRRSRTFSTGGRRPLDVGGSWDRFRHRAPDAFRFDKARIASLVSWPLTPLLRKHVASPAAAAVNAGRLLAASVAGDCQRHRHQPGPAGHFGSLLLRASSIDPGR